MLLLHDRDGVRVQNINQQPLLFEGRGEAIQNAFSTFEPIPRENGEERLLSPSSPGRSERLLQYSTVRRPIVKYPLRQARIKKFHGGGLMDYGHQHEAPGTWGQGYRLSLHSFYTRGPCMAYHEQDKNFPTTTIFATRTRTTSARSDDPQGRCSRLGQVLPLR